MPTAHKLPSGSWRVQVSENGKRKSITAPTKREAERMAAAFLLEVDRKERVGITVGEALQQYIDARRGVSSPTTISGYEKMQRNYMLHLQDVPISSLTQQLFQRYCSELARTKSKRGGVLSPKTVKEIVALYRSAISSAGGPSFKVVLPALNKPDRPLLTPEEVYKIAHGTNIELPVLLAMWLSLTMSEIRGLTVSSVVGDQLHVKGAVVDVDGIAVHKISNKTYERTRILRIPPRIMELIKQTDAWKAGSGYLVTSKSNGIYKKWVYHQKKAGIEDPMNFHGLRHINASVMLALVPPKYAQERGGWSSGHVMHAVYEHTIRGRQDAYDNKIDDYFESIINSCANSCAQPPQNNAESRIS